MIFIWILTKDGVQSLDFKWFTKNECSEACFSQWEEIAHNAELQKSTGRVSFYELNK